MTKRGQSLVLSSILALLSYVPFEIVAKFTLIFCGIIFVVDPIPPTSRLVSLVSVVLVGALSKIERQWREGQELLQSKDDDLQEGKSDKKKD
jgi:hypothetical protein